MFIRFPLVFDLLFVLFGIAVWPSAGKSCPRAFHLCCFFYFSAVLVARVPFPFVVCDRLWNSIVSVLDLFLFIYFAHDIIVIS